MPQPVHPLARVRKTCGALLCALALCAGSAIAADPSLPGTATLPPRSVADLLAQAAASQPPADARRNHQALLAAPLPASATPQQLFQFHEARGWAAYELGDAEREIAEFELALKAGERAGGFHHLEALQATANAHIEAGNFARGMQLREQLAEMSMPEGRRITVLAGLIGRQVQIGRLADARKRLQQLELSYDTAGGLREAGRYAYFWRGFLHMARAMVASRGADVDVADAEFRAAVAAMTEDQAAARARAGWEERAGRGTLNISVRALDLFERAHAQYLIRVERFLEAELALRRVIARQSARVGFHHVETAQSLALMAELMLQTGRYPEAAQLGRSVLKLYDDLGVVAFNLRRATALRTLGRSLAAGGQWEEALAIYDRVARELTPAASSQPDLAWIEYDWALALILKGRAAEALTRLEPVMRAVEAHAGGDVVGAALLGAVQAHARHATGDHAAAWRELQAVLPVLVSAVTEGRVRGPATALQVRRAIEAAIDMHFTTRFEAPGMTRAARESAAFALADLARDQALQGALSRAAARMGVRDPALATLIRQEQDLEREIEDLNAYLVSVLALPVTQRLQVDLAATRARLQAITRERSQLAETLRRRHPDYASLVRPLPVTLDEVRAALRPTDVFLAITTTEVSTLVWAVPAAGRGEVMARRVPLGREAVRTRVAGLRQALVLDSAGRIPPFDTAGAHALYEALLAPVAGAWAGGRRLVVALAGPLQQLPLSVLVTDAEVPKPARPLFAEYAKVRWLGQGVATLYVPSAASYVRLRALPSGQTGRKPFIGFGDPDFAATGTQPASSAVGVQVRAVGFRRSEDAALWQRYGDLQPLPETREELRAIARVLGADPASDVIVGRDSTPQRVKQADLATRRVVMFATHGLLPGELPGLDQPALALAPGSGTRDLPVLRLEDILGLKLDADLVVLSACNTAADDGRGAEAMSGLGRGFFYAGSRAVLMTHWPVETESARRLTTRMFEHRQRGQGTDLATALQSAMQSLAQEATGDYAYAHPLFWAPFVVVGDG